MNIPPSRFSPFVAGLFLNFQTRCLRNRKELQNTACGPSTAAYLSLASSPGSTSRPFPEAQAALFGQPAQAAALPASWAAGPTHPSFAFAGTLELACCGGAGGSGVVGASLMTMDGVQIAPAPLAAQRKSAVNRRCRGGGQPNWFRKKKCCLSER